MQYLRTLAKSSARDSERMKSLVPFFDAKEKLIAEDLDLESLLMAYRDVHKTRDALPLAELRAQLADPATTPMRCRACLHLLSACGEKDDLPMLETWVFGKDERKRQVLDRSIACYLILGGEAKLSAVEAAFLKPSKDRPVDSWDTYLAFCGVQLAARAAETIPRKRLIALYRPLLNQPRYFNIVVLELTRLKDWDSTARIIELSRTDSVENGELFTRGAIIHFLRSSPLAEAKPRLAEMTKLFPEAAKLYETVKPF